VQERAYLVTDLVGVECAEVLVHVQHFKQQFLLLRLGFGVGDCIHLAVLQLHVQILYFVHFVDFEDGFIFIFTMNTICICSPTLSIKKLFGHLVVE